MANNKKETVSYQQQLNYIKKLWTDIKENYIENSPMPSMAKHLDFNRIDKLMDLDGEELYSIKFFYYQLLNFTGKNITILHPNFLSLVMVVITAILKERNIKNYLPDREDIIQTLYKRIVVYRKDNSSPVQCYIGDDYKKLIETILPDLIQQAELDKIKKYLNKPNTLYQQEQEKTLNLQNEIDEKLNQQQQKIDELKAMLENQHKELNFVGLSNAFSKIQKEKMKLKNDIVSRMFWTFTTLLAIPLVVFICILFGIFIPTLYTAIPTLTFEILLLYLFRLFYQQFLFVKSELLQLDLRINLCAFIENYMEFKGKHKDDTVHLFEQLIFSNIISDEKKVPSTVDGLDTLAKLISEIKK